MRKACARVPRGAGDRLPPERDAVVRLVGCLVDAVPACAADAVADEEDAANVEWVVRLGAGGGLIATTPRATSRVGPADSPARGCESANG